MKLRLTSPRRFSGELVRKSLQKLSNHGQTVMQTARKHSRIIKASTYVPAYGTATFFHVEHATQAIGSGLWWSGLMAVASLSVLTWFESGEFLRRLAVITALFAAALSLAADMFDRLGRWLDQNQQ